MHVDVTSQLVQQSVKGRLVAWMTAHMRVLVAFVVLVVLPCASAVDRELTDDQTTVGTEPKAAEPAPAQGLSDDGRMAQVPQDGYVDTYREPRPHSLFIATHPV